MSSILNSSAFGPGAAHSRSRSLSQYLAVGVSALVFSLISLVSIPVASAQELVSPLPYPPKGYSSSAPPNNEIRTKLQRRPPIASPGMEFKTSSDLEKQEEVNAEVAATTTLDGPYGIAVDPGGNIYVANIYGNNVTVYNKSFKLIGTITAGMNSPAAVAISFDGDIFVANDAGNNINIYSPEYTPINDISDASLQHPYSMYIDKNDDVWVLDATGTVHVYLVENGAPVGSLSFGGSGGAIGPWGPYVTVWGVPSASGPIEAYQNVGDALHYGVEFEDLIVPSPAATGEAEDQFNEQYVTVPTSNLIQIFASDGQGPISSIATPHPSYGIAVDSINNRIYVSETTVNKVDVYSLTTHAKIGSIE